MTKKVNGAIVTKVNKKTKTITLQEAQIDSDIATLQHFDTWYNYCNLEVNQKDLIDIVKILVSRELERSHND
jgi:hypothetical protein